VNRRWGLRLSKIWPVTLGTRLCEITLRMIEYVSVRMKNIEVGRGTALRLVSRWAI